MQVMSYETWCEKNQDLVDEIRAELHPSGVRMGVLADVCAEGARASMHTRLRRLYKAAVQRDTEALKKWNEICAPSGGA